MSEARSTRDINDEVFGMAASSQGFFPAKGENTTVRKLFHGPRGAGRRLHIGGVSPSRPMLMRSVSNEPSGSFFMKAITLAPGFNSDLSAGT